MWELQAQMYLMQLEWKINDPCDRLYLAKGESINELHGASISEDADGLYRISVKKAVGVEVTDNGWV